MFLAGDYAQVQFATVGVRPHLSGPRGSLASLRAGSLLGPPTLSGSVSHPGRTTVAGTVMTAVSNGEAGRLRGEPGP